jgi:hypothetical protein
MMWAYVGLGVIAGAAVTTLVLKRYQRTQSKRLEESDPRAAELRALIREAESLLNRGRKRAAGSSS